MSIKPMKHLLALVCVVALFGVLQTKNNISIVRAAEASEKPFVPVGWIGSCKHSFRAVGGEYMLTHVLPRFGAQRNRYEKGLRALQDSCRAEPATVQEYREWVEAIDEGGSAPRARSRKERAASYYAHWCVAQGERIAADEEVFSRIRDYISNRDAARIAAEQDKTHSALEAFCQMPFAVKSRNGQRPSGSESRAFLEHGNAVMWPTYEAFWDMRRAFYIK